MRAIILTLILLLAANTAGAQDTPRWAAPSALLTVADTSLPASTSGTELSVIFDRFTVDAQGPGAPLSATRTATLSARLEAVSPPGRVVFRQMLRGAVTKDANSRVVIVIVMPDRTETLVFPYGRAVDEGDLRRSFRSVLRYRDGQPYTASFFVRIDRRTPDAAALVTLGSFDVRASQPPR